MTDISIILLIVGFGSLIGSLLVYALRTKDWSIFLKFNAEDSEMTVVEKIMNNGGLILAILGFLMYFFVDN